MGKIKTESSELYFASLKLIENLFLDGHIPDYMFKNILNEAEGKNVDITRFITFIDDKDGGKVCTD